MITEIPGKGIVVTGGNLVATSRLALDKKEQPRKSVPYQEAGTAELHAPWGEIDDWPVQAAKEAAQSTVITPGMTFKVDMLYGGGPVCFTPSEGGNVIVNDPRWRDFERKSAIHDCLVASAKDLFFTGSAFVQIGLNLAGNQILWINATRTRARRCRFEWMKPDGTIRNVHYNANFGTENYQSTRHETKILPLIDITYDPAEWLREYIAKGGTARQFIYPVQYISLGGEDYYPVPDWNSARASKWLSLSLKIAKLKDYFMDNQVNIKYHVEYDERFWPARFGAEAWSGMSADEKLAAIEQEVDATGKFLSGQEGKSVYSSTMLAPHFEATGTSASAISLVKINEFKTAFIDGIHNQDSQEASSHLLFALGLHTSIFGSGPGKSVGGGSGSENRVAFEQRVRTMRYYKEKLLTPLDLWRDFNRMPPEWEFTTLDNIVPTLDQVPPSQRLTEPTDANLS